MGVINCPTSRAYVWLKTKMHLVGKKKHCVHKQTQKPFSLRRADRQEKQRGFADLAKLELNVWNTHYKTMNVSEYGVDFPKENVVACVVPKPSKSLRYSVITKVYISIRRAFASL
jgi:hypothetical protein